ncbi:hypothetical protein C5167_012268 [Papaver somniferum]|uniref:WAT1-related protein n=1 Tax=Papaver somniferum TaxID=3469 RepID=A0A4Y7J0F7_PAPSO|nr:WAT1-related protein At5g47470-like [Papaver somniferum]RZC53431.1 hypothetical protein C5167_012268 [Papaver somniferum]
MLGSTTTPATNKFFHESVLIVGLIGVQIVYSVYSVIMSNLMALGLSPLFLVIYCSFATSLFLFPLCVYFERSKWPKEFSTKLLGQLLLISFGGVTLFQSLLLVGVKKTSPAIACAMPNLAPGIIFVIAWALRFEKVNLSCIYSKVKILGTCICVIGAITMSILYAPGATSESTSPNDEINEEVKLVGIICLMTAILVLSCVVVLQAATLGDFPAPMTLCAITSFAGAILTAVVKMVEERGLVTAHNIVRTGDLVGYAILGGIVSGACTSFNAWAMKRKGPVYVSTFNPIGTVSSVILSALTLGDSISLGSVCGMFLMFTGLYFVLWAKKKENVAVSDDVAVLPKSYESEKPLLC